MGRNDVIDRLLDLDDKVALLAEGVGRNRALWLDLLEPAGSPSSRRAWVEMSVRSGVGYWYRSPSSRRAWVEITMSAATPAAGASPSSRRAWVEILRWCRCCLPSLVALLAEGVGRNALVL